MATSLPAPWDADRPLDEARVARAIERQFPELTPARVEWFGSGWDNDVYRVNGDWLFRFPRRAEIVPTIEPERRLLERLAGGVSIAIPRFEWTGRPGPEFPYPFVGYRLIPGVGADSLRACLPPAAEWTMAVRLGHALAEIHAVPVEEAIALGAARHAWGPRGAARRARALLPRLKSLAAPDLVRDYAALLDGAVDPPPPSKVVRLAHGDLGADHLLVDPATFELTGLIDFADAGLYDPAIDFVALFQWRGEAFVRTVLDHYPLPYDPGLLDRVRFDAIVHGGVWLAESELQKNHDGVRMHRERFERVIGPALRAMLRGGS